MAYGLRDDVYSRHCEEAAADEAIHAFHRPAATDHRRYSNQRRMDRHGAARLAMTEGETRLGDDDGKEAVRPRAWIATGRCRGPRDDGGWWRGPRDDGM